MERFLENAPEDFKEFSREISAFAEAGATRQQILGLKMFHAVENQDAGFMGLLLEELKEFAKNNRAVPQPFSWFDDHEDLLGAIHLLQALIAKANGDDDAFANHMKEAFWTSPGTASFYAEIIQRHRREIVMRELRVPLDIELKTAEGTPTTLARLLGDNEAILIDFWAEWCGPCLVSIPAFLENAEQYGSYGIVFAGMNVDADHDSAREVAARLGVNIPWILDTPGGTYSSILDIQYLPSAVLINRDGRVLYNGHPLSSDLISLLDSMKNNNVSPYMACVSE